MPLFDSATSKPTMSQALALWMTYRLMYRVLQAPLGVLLILSVALRLCYFVFDRLTNDHTILSLLLTVALTSSVRRLIGQAAPDKASEQEALAKTRAGLPFLMFVAACLFTNYFISPLESSLGIRSILTWAPILTFSWAVRAAAFALLLGFSVVARYVGPPSIMRCSSSPLLEHPFQTALNNMLSNLTMDALLDFVAGPNTDMPGPMVKTPFDYRGNGRRFQNPMWISTLSQLLLTTMVAWMVSYIAVLPLFSSSRTLGETPFKVSIVLTCVVSAVTHLVTSALTGTRHELDPFRHQSHLSMPSARLLARGMATSLLVPSLLVVGCAILAREFYSENSDGETTADGIWTTIAVSLVTGSLVYLYLEIFDEIIRHLLCSSGRNIGKMVEEIADDDSLEALLDVAMYSLLHSHASLIEAVGVPSKPSFHDLEREELRRNDNAIKAMATTLLCKSIDEETSAHLEEDILRLSVLSSLGGGSTMDDTTAAIEQNIKRWVQPETTPALTLSGGEPAVVPLFRSLCAYIGGLGEAISICSGQKGSTKANPWLLPPGAIACGTYAVRAASRLVLYNLSVSTKTLADWRSTHLSMLIPVFLNCAHRLESGMVSFVQERISDGVVSRSHLGNLDLFRREGPDFLPLYQAIFESSLAILEKLKSLEGIRRVNFPVSPECSRWVDNIVAKIPNNSSHQTPQGLVPSITGF